MLKELRQKYAHRIPLYVGIFIVIAAASTGLFYGGYELGIRHPKVVTVENVANTDSKAAATANFGAFWEAWDVMKNEYLKGADLKDQKMVYGAITGLVNSAGDPHTIFLPPADSVKFQQDVSGNFGGIGAEIGIKNNQLVVIAPLKNNPAEQAGVKAGDAIVAINGKATDGIDVNTAVEKIRGEIGTSVTLTIFRNGWDHTKDFKIIRENIRVPTLDTEIVRVGGRKLAHISLYAFNENAPLGFYQAALTALLNKADGVILDLRDNPGGYLEVATNLAGWFVTKGSVVVKERYRSGNEDTFRADGNEALKDVPLIVLVNKGSASASEILAGALRAIRGTKLVGTNTYGKGTVQELRTLSDNSQIKLTIANWVLPDDTIISEDGLVPDVAADLSDSDIANHNDTQLKAAENVLLQELNK